MSAFRAELGGRGKLGSAVGANARQGRGALFAELCAGAVVVLAAWTLHWRPPETERGERSVRRISVDTIGGNGDVHVPEPPPRHGNDRSGSHAELSPDRNRTARKPAAQCRVHSIGSSAARRAAISASSRAWSLRNWVFRHDAIVKSGRAAKRRLAVCFASPGRPFR